ncbi:MAG: PASTA domain-containing protein [Burkholderiales bacterium]
MRLPAPLSRALRLLLAIASLSILQATHAATASFSLLLDTDNNPATGCTIPGPGGPIAGIDQVATTVVDTSSSGATVTRLERQVCSGGALGAPAAYDPGGWAVGFGNGTAGTAVVESSIPLGMLPSGGSMRAVAVSQGGGGQDATSSFSIALQAVGGPNGPFVPVPLSPWLVLPLAVCILATALWMRRRYPHRTDLAAFLVVFAFAGLAWAATVIRDGNVGDWAGVSPAVTDARGDAPPNADIVAVFYQQDAANLYLRFDADLRKDVVNQPPVVSAGAGQTITLPAMANLQGTATDDGLPNPPGALTLAWTKVSGPGAVTFANATSAATTATFSLAGTYVLRLTANDGALSASADVTIVVNDVAPPGANQPPTVSAGAAQSITLPATASLAGNATDDGKPSPPGMLVTTWSLGSGPGFVTFANPNALATTAQFSAPGVYTLTLTAFDGELSSSATTQVTVADGAPQIAPIANRTVVAGTRLQVVVAATDAAGDVLTYSLPVSPAGAALNPAPLIDWTPSLAQLGTHAITVQVTDSSGHSASVTFNVTVTAPANTPPVLAAQENQIVAIGTPFARKLAASDPDAGELLTFSLVSGPSGMTLAGADLSWLTAGRSAGDYNVTVRVTDKAGAYDQKSFTVTLQASASPIAVDDNYETRVGETLTVQSPGVLGNDENPSGKPITAVKLTDPSKGTLSAFNADGSFTFVAPASIAPPPFGVAEAWRNDVSGQVVYSFPLVGDVNGDGFPDLVVNHQGGTRAVDGRTGATLWNLDATGYTDCNFFTSANAHVLADVDDDGKLEYVGALAGCERDTRITSPGYAPFDRIFALDTTTGRVKWMSPRVSAALGDVLAPGTPPSTEERFQHVYDGTSYSSMHVARLSAGAAPTLMFRANVAAGEGAYAPIGGGPNKSAGCRGVTGDPADQGTACRMTILMSGADGAILAKLRAPNPSGQGVDAGGRDPWRERAPFTADLDGDGELEIVSGSDVWKKTGGTWTLLWQTAYEPVQALAADLDGDGKPEVIHFYAFNKTGGPSAPSDPLYQFVGLVVYDGVTGAVKRYIRLPYYWTAWLTIADVDGDGAPDFILNSNDLMMAVAADGRIKWTYVIPARGSVGAGARSGAANVQVYDLDGDGIPEVVTNSATEIVILNGRTGAVKASIPSAGLHGSQYAATNVQIVDADNDGHADIVAQNVSSNTGLFYTMVRGAPNNWLPGPKSFHQANFLEGDVDDAGHVLFNAAVPRSFRNPKQRGTVGNPRLTEGAAFTYAVSDGVANSAPATVFVKIKPANQPPVITSTPPTSLLQRFNPNPPGGLYTNYYQVNAYDPDAGDTLTYSLSAPSYVTMNAGGLIRFEPTCGSYGYPCPWGWTFVTVRVTDSQGAFAEQSFMVNLTTSGASVPNVVGMLLPAAESALGAAGLGARVQNEVYDAAPAGTVLAQDPVAGAPDIAAGAAVNLTLSKGPQPVTMPFVVGQQIANAYATLAGLGLSVNVASTFSTTIPAGEVMTQSPAFGTLLIPATAPPVDLTVSAGGPLPAPIARIDLVPGNATRLATESIPYRAVATLTDGTGADVTLKATWSSSAAGVASISPAGIAKAIAAGSTDIRATVGSAQGSTALTVVARTNVDTTPPAVQITAPSDGTSVKQPVSVTGSATDANFLRYELAFAAAGSDAWTVIGQGTSPVSAGTLGAFDPTMLENDLYTLRLTAFDRGGNIAVAEVTVQVEGNRKIGPFSLSYTDLSIPTPGVPVTVMRTYDSRVKSQGDFGIGWRLGVQTLQLRTNRVLGTGWERTVSGPTVTLSPLSEHRISLTLSDGTVEQFDLVLSPTSNIGSLDFTRVTGIAPRAGTLGKMAYLGNPDLLIVDDGVRTVLLDDTTLDVFDPRLFRYTTIDGLVMEIDRIDGVRKVVDRNGNTVSYGPAGIVHSNGRSILFNRDAKGRVVQVVDPDGRVFAYGYDDNGDLVRVVDPAGATSRYRYDARHNLIEIVDPSGRGGIRSEYDDAGRLVAVIDAAGKRVEFAHDLALRRETVTDRRGNLTTVEYDDDGNPTRQQAAVTIDGVLTASVVTMSHDARGNLTAYTDADGRSRTSTFDRVLPLTETADPGGLGLTTTYTYNGVSDPTKLVDPAGRSFDFVYDGSGNLTSATNPLTGSSTASFDGRGLVSERIDALGNHTRLTRDGAGNLIREEAFEGSTTLLRRVEHAYDASGRRTRSTLYRTIGGSLTAASTDFTYDAAGRLASVRDPLGATTTYEYDAAGRRTAQVDAQGRRTTYAYDTLGRPERTTFPDGTFETRSYDANGNLVQSTDRAGRVTTYAYDELNRKVATTLPGGATSRSIVSPAGLVTATIDARGQRTDFVYDSVGRLVEWKLPEVVDATTGTPVRPRFTRTLNALGAPLTTTDPRGGVTSFHYDASGRLDRVTYPDGAQATRSYDALGRLVQEVDEDGQATSYSYDALGRLVSVAGARGQATYAYDEAGALVAQTDALGRVTRYVYDAAGRLVEKRTPAGRSERYTYAATGELVARTDPAGRVTTMVNDAMGRVVSIVAPGSAPIAFTYAADGQRASASDARGTTTYTYDAAGRLASVSGPGGQTVSYTYDAAGNIATMATPSASVTYAYDAAGRMQDVTAPEGVTHYGYDAAGNRVRRTAANGVRSDVVFDARGRPTDLAHRDAGGAVLASFTNTWSPAGRRTRTAENGGAAEDYGYDALGRLVSHVRTGAGAFTDAYAYDAVGNRTQRVRDGVATAYSYDVDDRLVTAGASTMAWDVNGNLVSVAGPGGSVQYGYDAFDRMASVTTPGGVVQYEYDADGAQVGVNGPGTSVRRLVAHRNPTRLSQVLEERDGAGSLIARYTTGPEVLAQTRGGATSFYLRDTLGSVRALAGAAGTFTDSYRYDAWGASLAATGATANPLRFAGERLDDASGFYNLRARHLDPANGRFTSRDTFDGDPKRPASLNRFAYAEADPVNRVDPLGNESLIELTFFQNMQQLVDNAEVYFKARRACKLMGKLSTAQLLLGLGSLAATAVASLESYDLGRFGDGQGGWGMAAEAPMLSLTMPNASTLAPGSFKKFDLRAIGGGGKAGLKMAFETVARPTLEFQFAAPPPEFQMSVGFTVEKVPLATMTECGAPVGELFLEPSFKLVGGPVPTESGGFSVTGGFSIAMDMKLEAFGGAIQWGAPAFLLDALTTGFRLSVFGATLTGGWVPVHSL